MARKMTARREHVNSRSQKGDSFRRNIIRGVTGVAITAGAIAVGAAMASKKNRDMLKKGATRAFKGVTAMARTFSMPEKSMSVPVAHKVSLGRRMGRRRRAGMGRGRRSKR